MTQEAIEISTTPPLPGLKLVQDVNKALQTIATDFAGPTDPAGLPGCVPYCTWADTANGLRKRRNAANTTWEVEGKLFVDGSKAENIDFENLNTGLGADDVQAAISEVVGHFPFRGIQVYDTPGTYTWTVPEGVTKAWVHVTAGGGGGGYHGSPGRGGGGGAGGTAIKLVDLTGVSSVSVTVGAGGAAGSFSVNGGNGGASSFGTFASATGGHGGTSQAGSTPPAGGLGGTATGGDINITGGGGDDGHEGSLNQFTAGGAGGAGFYGGNGKGGSPIGIPGFNGGGGGGSAAPAGEPNTATGGDGIVTIQW